MTRLIHLNGPPGIGKSTLAARYAEEHPHVLNCDIDTLRSMIGGWRHDFVAAGDLIRPAALAMIGAYLRTGNDVVLPQLLLQPEEIATFEECATRAGAQFVERILMDTAARSVTRFHQRGTSDPRDAVIKEFVHLQGGEVFLVSVHAALEQLAHEREGALVIPSVEGDVRGTHDLLVTSLG
ncbi:MAG TPA: AAA family ATPase [Marmoricola sp.]|nr:AAA family ATPase [Marmoricola sp.]